jgi:hypothetical protein
MFEDLKYKIQEKWTDFIGNPFFESIRLKYEALPRREQRLIKASSIFFIVFIIFYGFYSVLDSISEKQEEIKESVLIIQKLDDLNNYISEHDSLIKSRRKNPTAKFVSLFDLVEKQELQAKIKPESRVELKEEPRKELKGQKYIENSALVKYKKVTIRELKNLLLGIESNEVSAKIDSLKIKRNPDDKRYVDAEFEVVSRVDK